MLDSHYILEKCAKAILNDGPIPSKADMSLLAHAFENHMYKEMASFLAERVEHFSGGKYTIRQADPSLFRGRTSETLMYLVRCPHNTPEGKVTRLSEDMELIVFGAVFIIGAPASSK